MFMPVIKKSKSGLCHTTSFRNIKDTMFILARYRKNIKFKIHRNEMLALDLYGCETWFLSLREEERLADRQTDLN
jgi:ferredoxin-fold anticodon binding domain-containing protein